MRQPGKTAGGVAREMGLTVRAVRAWVRQAELDEGVRAEASPWFVDVPQGESACGTRLDTPGEWED